MYMYLEVTVYCVGEGVGHSVDDALYDIYNICCCMCAQLLAETMSDDR